MANERSDRRFPHSSAVTWTQMKLRWKIRRKARRLALKAPNAMRRRNAVYRMRRQGDPQLDSIAAAVSTAKRGRRRAVKLERLADIEGIRHELLASPDTIEVPVAGMTGDPSHVDVLVESVRHACLRSREERWCRFLFELTRRLRPQEVLELGTCVGISAAYIGTALDENETGRLVTVEAVAGHVELACATLRRLRLDHVVEVQPGLFEEVLRDVLARQRSIDLVFIDGNHHEAATVGYFETIRPFLSDQAVVIYDDISYSDGMERAWKTVIEVPNARYAVDLGPIGLCLYRPEPAETDLFYAPVSVKPKGSDRAGWTEP